MSTDRFNALNSPASVDIECPTSAFSYPQGTETDVDLCFDLRSTLTPLYTPVGESSKEPRLSVSRRQLKRAARKFKVWQCRGVKW